MSDVDPTSRQWVSGTRGVPIKLDTEQDLTGAAVAIMLRPPETEGPALAITADVVVDQTNPHIAVWTVTSSHLDTPGLYQMRVRATYPGSIQRYSSVAATLEVIEP